MEVNEQAPALEMKNGMEKEINYPQKFVQHPNPNKPGPTNEAAKHAHCDPMMNLMDG